MFEWQCAKHKENEGGVDDKEENAYKANTKDPKSLVNR